MAIKSYKTWAAVCLSLGTLIGVAGVTILIKVIYLSKISAYIFGMFFVFMLVSLILIYAGIKFIRSGKNKIKFEQIKDDVVDTLSTVVTGV